MSEFRVHLQSVPGPYEQYDGYVDVIASDSHDAKKRAFDKLRRTSFPDRGASMWKVVGVERDE